MIYMIEVNHKTVAAFSFLSGELRFSLLARMNVYETERLLSEYLLFHYAKLEEVLPWTFGPGTGWNFPLRVVEAAERVAGKGGARALDLGCAVGRAAFELTRRYEEVVGIDFSHRFIEAAQALKARGELPYERIDEGTLTTPLIARVPQGARCDRVEFYQGDALALGKELGRFDLVLAANLLCRLAAPARCLERMKTLINPGGFLVITTPGTWMEEYTPRVHWLGGREREGLRLNTFESIRAVLEPEFLLRERDDLPFLIREHVRKYQWSVAELSIWQLR